MAWLCSCKENEKLEVAGLRYFCERLLEDGEELSNEICSIDKERVKYLLFSVGINKIKYNKGKLLINISIPIK